MKIHIKVKELINLQVKTAEEIAKLKMEWKNDPCYDLYDVEGFEPHKEELKQFQEESETEWKMQRIEKDEELNAEADKLGIHGLYRIVKQHQILLDRHNRAIETLADGNSFRAYQILQGYD